MQWSLLKYGTRADRQLEFALKFTGDYQNTSCSLLEITVVYCSLLEITVVYCSFLEITYHQLWCFGLGGELYATWH